MKLFLVTFSLIALAFAGIVVKIWAKKEVNFQVLVPVKVLSIKITRLVAIVGNCLLNKIVEQIHKTTNPFLQSLDEES